MSPRTFLACGAAALLMAAAARADDADKAPPKSATAKPTVAVFRLTGEVSETPGRQSLLALGSPGTPSLKEFVARIEQAAKDPAVKAIVILPEGGSTGLAQKEELRQALRQFQDAGKEVFAHADSLSMGDYILLSGATRLSVTPTADVNVTGFYGEAPYLRGLLDLLGIRPDLMTCGDYKSAAELFMRTGPSPEADRMQNWLLDSVYDTSVKLIAQGRKTTPEKVRAWIDAGPYAAAKAKDAGLIDAVEHRQDFESVLKEKYGKDVVFDRKYGAKKSPTLDLSSPLGLMKVWADLLNEARPKKSDKPAVGIVYVDGAIVLGKNQPSIFGTESAASSEVRKALDDAAADDSVKAVVLRVDSPGGSAVASEIILDATRRVKAKKPLVVSMGNVAGSGGYYVACAADVIFADEATITGSIGVFSGKLVTNPMWNKVGITFKDYQRGAHAGLMSASRPYNPEERAKVRDYMEEIYATFKGHVQAIRGTRLKKPLEELAGGRVYTGRQALELGLVDRIGTLEDAVKFAAVEAKLKDYDVRVVPEPKGVLEKLLEEAAGGKTDPHRLGVARGDSLVELAMPYLQHLDPQRVRVIQRALGQLQLLSDERVLMTMPELGLPR
jgi:protease-4